VTLRRSLQNPIAELELAASLLDCAVAALMLGHRAIAAELIARANLPDIRMYAIRSVGPMSTEVHRQVRRPMCIPREERDPRRMPNRTHENEIFARDGWRCRFCGIRVISRSARAVLCREFPVESSWTRREFERHSALYAMAASLDHVIPHGRGGPNEVGNFVTACYCCQFGRGEWLIEEVELEDPRGRPAGTDEWDGLTRVLRSSWATRRHAGSMERV
jgi:5-methylcytosine-specific restriction endonuclease McrA